jgi:hypothetical protein
MQWRVRVLHYMFKATLLTATLVAALAGIAGIVWAQTVHIDMDQDLMQVIDDTTKEVNSNLALKDAKAATADAEQLENYFKEVETIFVQQGQADDGVALAKQARAAAIELGKSVNANDFDTAQINARSLTRTCKSCHDVYKST